MTCIQPRSEWINCQALSLGWGMCFFQCKTPRIIFQVKYHKVWVSSSLNPRLSPSLMFYSRWPCTCLLEVWTGFKNTPCSGGVSVFMIIVRIIWCALKGVREYIMLTGLPTEVLHCLSAWPLCFANNAEPRRHDQKGSLTQKLCFCSDFNDCVFLELLLCAVSSAQHCGDSKKGRRGFCHQDLSC